MMAHRVSPARALLGAAVLLGTCGRWGLAAEVGEQAADLGQLSFEQLSQLLALELQSENGRPNETLFGFDEFQDIAEMSCQARLMYLMSSTVGVHNDLQTYHVNILGLSGLYMQLLDQLPGENTWIWLISTAHERAIQKISNYWSRVVALALDQHRCLAEELRDTMLAAIVRWKALHAEFMEIQWDVFAFGRYNATSDPAANAETLQQAMSKGAAGNIEAGNAWISNLREWFEAYANELLRVLQGASAMVLSQEGAVRSHHQDEHGPFVTYEFLRRKVFKQWAIDKGLMRGLLRYVWQPPRGQSEPLSVADFGAGGGHYSTWLNETGLVHSFAFDGTNNAAELTDGVVQELNLVGDVRLWRTFEWVMCLEVGEHVPKQFASALLRNLRRHARQGLIMSWSSDWEGIGHVNCLPREEFVAFVQAETGLVLDAEATQKVKDSCEIEYIARTIAVFRAPPV